MCVCACLCVCVYVYLQASACISERLCGGWRLVGASDWEQLAARSLASAQLAALSYSDIWPAADVHRRAPNQHCSAGRQAKEPPRSRSGARFVNRCSPLLI